MTFSPLSSFKNDDFYLKVMVIYQKEQTQRMTFFFININQPLFSNLINVISKSSKEWSSVVNVVSSHAMEKNKDNEILIVVWHWIKMSLFCTI
jgi:hypothetical protein